MSNILNLLTEEFNNNNKSLEEISVLRKQLYLMNSQRKERNLNFFKKMLSEEYGQDVSEHVLLPIGYNNFIINPMMDEYQHLGISGFQGKFVAGKLVSSNRTISIKISEWMDIPEDVKKQDISLLKEQQNTLKPTNSIFGNYNSAIEIYSNGDFEIVYSKARSGLNGRNIPRQISIVCIKQTKENLEKMENALEMTQTIKNEIEFHNKQSTIGSQVLGEDVNMSRKFFAKHESLLIHIFGENILDVIMTNINNSKNSKTTNAIVRQKGSFKEFSMEEIENML